MKIYSQASLPLDARIKIVHLEKVLSLDIIVLTKLAN